MTPSARALVVCIAFAGAVLPAKVTRAQNTPAPPITRNDFSLEFFQGPLLTANRVIGFAGAYAGMAEATDGTAVNAAAPAVREPFSYDWVDVDVDIDFSLPNAYGGTDFDNRGQKADPKLVDRVNTFFFAHAAAQVQVGEFGTAFTSELLRYNLTPSASGTPGFNLNYARFHLTAAYALANNQVVVGAGIRAVALQLGQEGGGLPSSTVLTMAGIAPQVGFVYKPDNRAWRIGATVRAPVSASALGGDSSARDATGTEHAGPFILPSRVVAPWEVEAGIAYQLGARPLNPPWLSPHDQERPLRHRTIEARKQRARDQADELGRAPGVERAATAARLAREEEAVRAVEDEHLEQDSARLKAIRTARELNWPRERILLLASVLITGPSNNAVALEGFLEQKREVVGSSASFSPRVGVESEPLVNWLRVRAGSYLEPSRFADGNIRQHFTFGGDVRLLPFDLFGLTRGQIWRFTVSGDLAPRYSNFGFGVAAWH